MKMIPVNIAVV